MKDQNSGAFPLPARSLNDKFRAVANARRRVWIRNQRLTLANPVAPQSSPPLRRPTATAKTQTSGHGGVNPRRGARLGENFRENSENS